MATGEASKPPNLGLLTRTLVESPVIKWIIPARIRHASKNDAIFVSKRAVQIQEIRRVGNTGEHTHLELVAVKNDFDSSIRAARVLGLPRAHEEEKPRRSGIDAIVKQEDTESPEPEALLQPEMPPHILAVTLESMKLVFICAFHQNQDVHFLSSYRQLPSARSCSEQLGEHLAVDPKSRAMAVAANEGSFRFYALKRMEVLKQEVDSAEDLKDARLDPIEGERNFKVDGVILKMEFLHPPKEDDDIVILLLVTSERTKTKLRRYEWDSSRHISEVVDKERERQRVADDQQLPLLMIPLSISTAFLLVFEDRLVTYTDILTGHATSHVHMLDHLEDPEEPGSSRAKPVFTQWARALRRDDYLHIKDHIYLCREDGLVRFLDISSDVRHQIDSSHAAGRLKANVSTAFATLDLGQQFDDLLVAGGEMSDGGLWLFRPRHATTKPISKIPNWTPSIDMIAENVSLYPNRRSGPVATTNNRYKTQKRTFVPTGRGSTHGAVTEVRLGIEASLLQEIYGTEKGVDQLWVLPDLSSASIHFLISYPASSSFFSLDPADTMLDDDDNLPIDTEVQTLAAGLSEDGIIIQVTASSVRAFQRGNPQRRLEHILVGETILKATILASKDHGCLLLVAIKAVETITLRLACIQLEGNNIQVQNLGEPYLLRAEPSCLSLQEYRNEVVAIIGSLAATLHLFVCSGAGPREVSIHTFVGEFGICSSVAMIRNGLDSRLVCGLRNGSVHTFLLDSQPQLIPQDNISIGDTPASVITDANNPSRAFVACGTDFCTLEYATKSSIQSAMTKVWITHELRFDGDEEEQVAVSQPDLRIPNDSWGFAEGHLICIAGDHLRPIQVDKTSQPHMIPQKLNLDGTPSRIIYSEKWSRLIVLYTRIVIIRPPQRTGHHFRPGQRSLQSVFGFFEPDKMLNRPDHSSTGTAQVLHETESKRAANIIPMQECKPGEKVLGMMEWFPTDEKYRYLVVHTMIVYVDNRAPTGRLIFYSLSADPDGYMTMRNKKAVELKAPVFAVAAYGPSSLVYSCGNDIHLLRLDHSPNTPPHLLPPATFALRSRGAHISVHAPFVFVTTASESLTILKIEEAVTNEETKASLVFHYGDEVARDGIYHLVLPAQSLILTSSKDCVVAGLWMPPNNRISNSLSTTFMADLPVSITRFHQLTTIDEGTAVRDDTYTDGRVAGPILGSSTDGTIYQMEILDEPSWLLLRFIINMAKRHPIICPFRDIYGRAANGDPKPHIEPSPDKKRHRHVDGDILMRLLDRGAENLLREMLEREPGYDEHVTDFTNAEARQERFKQLMVDAHLEQDDPKTLVDWIRKLLCSAI